MYRLFFYSRLRPTFPTRRSPQALIPIAASKSPKQAQKTARYPTIKASGEFLLLYEDPSVTLAAMMAKVVRPIDVPNWAIVLKTAPASPCVLGEKESAIIKFATVNITVND